MAKERQLKTRKVTRYWLGKKRSVEDKEKMRLAKLGKYIGEKNPFWGKTHSLETRKKISEANKGRIAVNPFKKGHIPWNRGVKQYIPEDEHYEWKGANVGYVGLHNWVRKHLGNPLICVWCKTGVDSSRKIHWANKSGKYKRELSDWLRLCVVCHWKHDRKRRLASLKSKKMV